jgi:hypothetical protein
MGTIIRFPATRRGARKGKMTADKSKSAIVVILPVVRIERFSGKPPVPRPGRNQRRRRRRAVQT